MKRIGAHVSIKGGIENAPINASKIEAKAFAMFTKSQLRWTAIPLKEQEIVKFKSNCKKNNYLPEYILPHSGYLINLGNPDKEGLKKSRDSFIQEIERVNQLGLLYLNFHPGSHKNKISEQECIKIIADSINLALNSTQNVTAVIETTAGQGGNIGYRFEQIASIIDKIDIKNRIGVCYDTCHSFAAGYDIRTLKSYKKTMKEFNKIIGNKFLKGFHINDSMHELGSKKDRHANLGKGKIGLSGFKNIINDPQLDDIPLILETKDRTLWKQEIKTLYELEKNK